jgi:hypothetical protein
MIDGVRRPCLQCGKLTTNRIRCEPCRIELNRKIEANRDQSKRQHYGGDYRRRAKLVREAATHCWICGETARSNDPWQADHVVPGEINSPLLPAHRSCNIRRGRGV